MELDQYLDEIQSQTSRCVTSSFVETLLIYFIMLCDKHSTNFGSLLFDSRVIPIRKKVPEVYKILYSIRDNCKDQVSLLPPNLSNSING